MWRLPARSTHRLATLPGWRPAWSRWDGEHSLADGGSFFEELKRRHVWRVAIAYAVVAWLLVQVATQIFPFFNIPDWTVRLMVVLIVIGFPIAVIFAWVYELTPEGIRRTALAGSPDVRAAHDSRQIGRKLNAVIIGTLVLAVALLGWRLLVLRQAPAAAAMPASVQATPARGEAAPAGSSPSPVPTTSAPGKSITVLPFENLSADKDNEYFVAGMQDLILTKLADIGDLKVISRTSTQKYKSHPDNLKQIAAELGVATILEGSVQKAGNQVLVNVQLIDAGTDSHIWAQDYTRTLDNIFGVEGDVAGKIAAALKARLSHAETARLAAAPTANQAALDLFLRAEYQASKGLTNYDTGHFKAAIPLYRQAIGKDPAFALAYARLSYIESVLAWFDGGGMDVKQLVAQGRVDAERALRLQPDLAAAQLALGYSDYYGRGDYPGALKAFATALTLRPNDADTLAARGYVERRQGRYDASIDSFQQALRQDPRNSVLAFELGATFMIVSRYPEAEAWLQRALALDPDNFNARSLYSSAILYRTGDVARALAAAQGDTPALKLTRVTLLAYQRRYPQALALLDSVPDSPDNFNIINGSKALQQAVLYRLMGKTTQAGSLFEQALGDARAQVARQQGVSLGFAWQNLASAEVGLGHVDKALAAIAKVKELVAHGNDAVYGPQFMQVNAGLYAQAGRADLAVPLIDQVLATPGHGQSFAPVLLWLDPTWDLIRQDPGFKQLLKRYAKHQPAPAASTSTAAAAPPAA